MDFLRYQLTKFAEILSNSKYKGQDTSSCDYIDVSASIARAKEETKAEIGALLLELLTEEDKKRETMRSILRAV